MMTRALVMSYTHVVCHHHEHYSTCTTSLLCFPWHCRYWLLVMLLALGMWHRALSTTASGRGS